jgi:hypothetical protein
MKWEYEEEMLKKKTIGDNKTKRKIWLAKGVNFYCSFCDNGLFTTPY